MSHRLLFVLLLLGVPARAALITLAPAGGTTTVLTTISGSWSSGPSVVAGGFTVTGSPDVWYGDTSYGFYLNGTWDGLAWVGGVCPDGGCTATFDLGGSFAAVGGFMNYAASSGPATITALAADGVTILETYDLTAVAPISTPSLVNEGAFRGIARGAADIAYLRTFGAYLVLHSITLSSSAAVPEPATFFLAGLALCALAAWRARR